MHENRTLEDLELSQNDIGDGGACNLALALEVNTSLVRLRLALNEIGPAGCRALARALLKSASARHSHLMPTSGAPFALTGVKLASAPGLGIPEEASLWGNHAIVRFLWDQYLRAVAFLMLSLPRLSRESRCVSKCVCVSIFILCLVL